MAGPLQGLCQSAQTAKMWGRVDCIEKSIQSMQSDYICSLPSIPEVLQNIISIYEEHWLRNRCSSCGQSADARKAVLFGKFTFMEKFSDRDQTRLRAYKGREGNGYTIQGAPYQRTHALASQDPAQPLACSTARQWRWHAGRSAWTAAIVLRTVSNLPWSSAAAHIGCRTQKSVIWGWPLFHTSFGSARSRYKPSEAATDIKLWWACQHPRSRPCDWLWSGPQKIENRTPRSSGLQIRSHLHLWSQSLWTYGKVEVTAVPRFSWSSNCELVPLGSSKSMQASFESFRILRGCFLVV